jgi:hypothetical protein
MYSDDRNQLSEDLARTLSIYIDAECIRIKHVGPLQRRTLLVC